MQDGAVEGERLPRGLEETAVTPPLSAPGEPTLTGRTGPGMARTWTVGGGGEGSRPRVTVFRKNGHTVGELQSLTYVYESFHAREAGRVPSACGREAQSRQLPVLAAWAAPRPPRTPPGPRRTETRGRCHGRRSRRVMGKCPSVPSVPRGGRVSPARPWTPARVAPSAHPTPLAAALPPQRACPACPAGPVPGGVLPRPHSLPYRPRRAQNLSPSAFPSPPPPALPPTPPILPSAPGPEPPVDGQPHSWPLLLRAPPSTGLPHSPLQQPPQRPAHVVSRLRPPTCPLPPAASLPCKGCDPRCGLPVSSRTHTPKPRRDGERGRGLRGCAGLAGVLATGSVPR